MLKNYHKEIDCSIDLDYLVETKVGVVSIHSQISIRACFSSAVFAADVVVNLIVIALGIKRPEMRIKVNHFAADDQNERERRSIAVYAPVNTGMSGTFY